MAHTHLGEVVLRDFAAKCEEVANLDKAPKRRTQYVPCFCPLKSAGGSQEGTERSRQKRGRGEAAAKAEENN